MTVQPDVFSTACRIAAVAADVFVKTSKSEEAFTVQVLSVICLSTNDLPPMFTRWATGSLATSGGPNDAQAVKPRLAAASNKAAPTFMRCSRL